MLFGIVNKLRNYGFIYIFSRFKINSMSLASSHFATDSTCKTLYSLKYLAKFKFFDE